jgi:hypothetical protein
MAKVVPHFDIQNIQTQFLNRDIPVIIEIQDLNGVIAFEGVLEKIPEMHREQINFDRGMGNMIMHAPSRITFDDVELNFIEESPKKQEYIEHWVQQVFEDRNYIAHNYKNIKLISLEPRNAFVINIFGSRISSIEMKYSPEINPKFKIISKVFVRKVLFEKAGSPTLEIEFNLRLQIEKFEINYLSQ